MCSLLNNVKYYVYVLLQVNIDSYLTSQDVDTECNNKEQEFTHVDATLTSNYSYFSSFPLNVIILLFSIILVCLQCFDTVG